MKDQESSCHKDDKETTVTGGKEDIEVTLGGKKQTNKQANKTKRDSRDFEIEKSRANGMEKKGDGCN